MVALSGLSQHLFVTLHVQFHVIREADWLQTRINIIEHACPDSSSVVSTNTHPWKSMPIKTNKTESLRSGQADKNTDTPYFPVWTVWKIMQTYRSVSESHTQKLSPSSLKGKWSEAEHQTHCNGENQAGRWEFETQAEHLNMQNWSNIHAWESAQEAWRDKAKEGKASCMVRDTCQRLFSDCKGNFNLGMNSGVISQHWAGDLAGTANMAANTVWQAKIKQRAQNLFSCCSTVQRYWATLLFRNISLQKEPDFLLII